MKDQRMLQEGSLHVDVQRHLMGIERHQEIMRIKCPTRFSTCKKIRSRTTVISRSWFRGSPQGEWDKMAEKMKVKTRRKRTPNLSSHESIVQRSVQKQRRGEIVDPPLCRNDHNCVSNKHFWKSAQSSRGSRRNV